MKFKFKIYEIHEDTNLMVASGEGNNINDVEKEAQHYAIQYSKDYPIKIMRNYSP